MEKTHNIFRLWKPIQFTEDWRQCDTSILDDIAPSWLHRRKKLVGQSTEYEAFVGRLKREHAIETGIIERLYDLDKGVTETLIKEGFIASFLSHGDSNVPIPKLLGHLKDQLEAVDFVFDIVKEDRPFSTSFIKALHQLVTRHQEQAEGRDQFGNRLKIPLLKGTYKVRENNPTNPEGITILYCPPEQVAVEMEHLVRILDQLIQEKMSPLIIASWLHYAFITIHPFQDGNGRIARLLTSLVFIKYGFFPFTVIREEAKVKYIAALEQADKGLYQPLVTYFGGVQRKSIEQALNVKEVSEQSLDAIVAAFNKKSLSTIDQNTTATLATRRKTVVKISTKFLKEFSQQLKKKINHNSNFSIQKLRKNSRLIKEALNPALNNYAQKFQYHRNYFLPEDWLQLTIAITPSRTYSIYFVIHHFGFEESVLAIGAFLYNAEKSSVMMELKPQILSIFEELDVQKEKNIQQYLENSILTALAYIASEL